MLPTKPLFRPIVPRSSYYETDYTQGKALARARRPYLVKNLVTGAAMFMFTIAVYTYTLKAVSQDDFEDVIVPDKPAVRAAVANSRAAVAAPSPRTPNVSSGVSQPVAGK